MILINVRFPVRADRLDEWTEVARRYARDVSAEEGNLFFEWTRSLDEPTIFVAVEGFRDAAAGEAHMKTGHVADFMAAAPDFVAEQPQVIFIDAPQTDGWVPMGEIKPR